MGNVTFFEDEEGNRTHFLAGSEDDPSKSEWRPMTDWGKVQPYVETVVEESSKLKKSASDFYKKKARVAEKFATSGFLDPQLAEQRKITDEMSFPEAFSVNAIREAGAFGRGTRDLLNSLAGMASGAVGAQDAEDYFASNTRQTMEDRDRRDQLWQGFEDKTFLSGSGKMVPFLMTGRYLEPLARATTGRALAKTGEVVKEGAKQTEGLLSRAIKKQAAEGAPRNPATIMSKEAEQMFLNPLEKKMAALKSQEPIRNEFREGILSQVGTYGGIGAAEGALHEDLTIPQGAAGSMVAGLMGRAVSPMFSHAPNKNSQAVNELIDDMEQLGFRSLPGLRKGIPEYQILESQLRTDTKYAGHYRNVDDANDAVITRMAGEAMGLDAQTLKSLDAASMRDITPEKLAQHRANLKAEFDQLEDVSIGKIDKSTLKEIDDLIKERELPKEVIRLQTKLKNLKHQQGRDERGRLTAATFGGKDYKKLSAEIKIARDSDKIQGHLANVDAYDRMLKALDDGMKMGVEKYGGEGTGAMWKDLRERYALTELMENHGLNPVGGVDANRLGKYLLEHDSKRLLEGSTGRIDNLHKIAKINYIQKNQAGGGLGKFNIEDDILSGKAAKQHQLTTPQSLLMPLRRKIPASMYTAGYPAETGLLGMRQENKTWGMPAMMRSAEQAGQFHTDPIENMKSGLRKTGAYGLEKTFDLKEWLEEMIRDEEKKRRIQN